MRALLASLLLLALAPLAAHAIGFSAAGTCNAPEIRIALAPDEHLDADSVASPLPFEIASKTPLVLRFDAPPPGNAIPLTYQLCVGTACYPPVTTNIPLDALPTAPADATPIAVAPAPDAPDFPRLVGYVDTPTLLDFLRQHLDASAPPPPAPAAAPKSLLWALPSLFLAGVLLNLTPCTLPLIPVTLIILGVGRSAHVTRRRRILVGLAYALGILVAYAALALLSSSAGALLGAYAASPWFNFAAAALLLLLALRPPDLARFRPRPAAAPQNNAPTAAPFRPVAIAFLYGLLTAALASACTAPALLAALAWSAQLAADGARVQALLLPMAIGLGLAAPWPFLAAGLSILPAPGAWMNRLAKLFTLLVLLLAAYYAFLGIRLLLPASAPAPDAATYDISLDSEIARLDADLADRAAPALLLFSASWCKNCHALQRGPLAASDIQDLLASRDVPLYVIRADHPSDAPAAPYLAALRVPAFPTLLLLPPP